MQKTLSLEESPDKRLERTMIFKNEPAALQGNLIYLIFEKEEKSKKEGDRTLRSFFIFIF